MPNSQFPITPPPQMPCPHWNHFPIHPQVKLAFGSCGGNGSTSPPPSPSSYSYCNACSACNAMKKRTA
ncbi:uncharacterized protein LOC105208939 [Zeugodacus cucurbitae]|uniref:uncharacterized protein LOC105208939 n=1 Tax=Zeugodacus cucurbitae TaxID=28588 RepID=UPI0005969522|nr:uncharacterized protein LOC105208939 [Zeugodacus cucurbitae]